MFIRVSSGASQGLGCCDNRPVRRARLSDKKTSKPYPEPFSASIAREDFPKQPTFVGVTKIHCPAQKIEFPKTAFEKAFFPEDKISKAAIRWLEREANQRGIYIHHALCGQGGERFVDNAPIDGYHHKSKMVSVPRLYLARLPKMLPRQKQEDS